MYKNSKRKKVCRECIVKKQEKAKRTTTKKRECVDEKSQPTHKK